MYLMSQEVNQKLVAGTLCFIVETITEIYTFIHTKDVSKSTWDWMELIELILIGT